MGTPLIQDSFHKDRWDYFYQMRVDGKVIEQRRVILEFENETLARVRGDVVAAGTDENGAAVAPATTEKQPEKKGLIDSLKFWKSEDGKSQATPQAAPADLISPKATTPAPAPQPAVVPVEKPVATPPPAPKPAPMESAPIAKPTPVEAPPVPAAKPAEVAPKPVVEEVAKPVEKPVEKVTKPAAVKAEPKPVAASKPAPAPEPEKDLPPEDAPGYFERMLEKIGF